MIRAAAFVYITGLLIFYSCAAFDQPVWWPVYYFWAKGCDLLVWGGIAFGGKLFRKDFVPIFIFSVIRFIWEIISHLTGLTVNNTTAIAVLFIILTLAVLFYLIKDLRCRLKD